MLPLTVNAVSPEPGTPYLLHKSWLSEWMNEWRKEGAGFGCEIFDVPFREILQTFEWLWHFYQASLWAYDLFSILKFMLTERVNVWILSCTVISDLLGTDINSDNSPAWARYKQELCANFPIAVSMLSRLCFLSLRKECHLTRVRVGKSWCIGLNIWSFLRGADICNSTCNLGWEVTESFHLTQWALVCSQGPSSSWMSNREQWKGEQTKSLRIP